MAELFDRFKPTQQQRLLVSKLASYGLSPAKISKCVFWSDGRPIDIQTLQKWFATELDQGCIKVYMQACDKIVEHIDNPDAAISLRAATTIMDKFGARVADDLALPSHKSPQINNLLTDLRQALIEAKRAEENYLSAEVENG